MVNRFEFFKQAAYLTLLFLFTQSTFAADIIARTDRATIGLNESFTLFFEATGSVDDDPDFSPLHQDFDILNTSQSSNVSIINGSMTRAQTWTLQLFPKKAGNVTIPEISFGKDKSPALPITIAKQATNTAASEKDIFLKIEIEPKTVYVQQQLIYTVRLYRAVITNNASLSEPEINSSDGVLLKLGEDRSYDTVVNGRRYNVFERQYAIFPQKADKLTIQPIQFTGNISSGRRRGMFDFGFDSFGQSSRMVREQSQAVNLEVKPIPTSYHGLHWLPAQSLQLSETWSPNPPIFKVGEPVTRSIKLTAVGLTAAQLPEFNLGIPDNLKQYPDQANLEDAISGNNMLGTRTEKLALIPTQPGRYTLPAIEIPWWNTQSQQQEIARLPAREIEVAAIAGSNEVAPIATPEQTVTQDNNNAETPAPVGQNAGLWPWLTLLLGLVWLATLGLWWRQSHKSTVKSSPAATIQKPDPAVALKRLRIACRDDDPQAAKQALLQWAQALWPNEGLHSLDSLMNRVDEKLCIQLQMLNARLYRQTTSDWQGNELWMAMQDWKSKQGKAEKDGDSVLEPLHRI